MYYTFFEQDTAPSVVNWNQQFHPNIHQFVPPTHDICPELGIDLVSSPFQIMQKFITDEMIDEIVTETNRYAEQTKVCHPRSFKGFVKVENGDIWKFFALILNMTLVKKASYKDYWNIDPMISTPFFASVMSRDRYIYFLHI